MSSGRGYHVQRPSNISMCGPFSNGKNKTKHKTRQYDWNNTNTNRADKDVLVGVDEHTGVQRDLTLLVHLILITT